MRDRLECPDQSDPLTAKLYATYLSFLPPEDFARPTVTHADTRGRSRSFCIWAATDR